MPKQQVLNPFFNFYTQTNEQDFYSDFVDEDIRLSGTSCLYIPKEYAGTDKILAEAYQVLYNRFYPIACRLTTPEGYSGEGDILSQFGLRFANTSEWVISKRMFRDLKIPGRDIRPLEGDLLMVGPSDGNETNKDPQFTYSLMEITYVKHESPNWPLGRYYVFQVMCQLYVASYEKFQTGSPDIDVQNSQYGNEANLDLAMNKEFEEKAIELVNFDEKNPFGDF